MPTDKIRQQPDRIAKNKNKQASLSDIPETAEVSATNIVKTGLTKVKAFSNTDLTAFCKESTVKVEKELSLDAWAAKLNEAASNTSVYLSAEVFDPPGPVIKSVGTTVIDASCKLTSPLIKSLQTVFFSPKAESVYFNPTTEALDASVPSTPGGFEASTDKTSEA